MIPPPTADFNSEYIVPLYSDPGSLILTAQSVKELVTIQFFASILIEDRETGSDFVSKSIL